MLRLSRLCRAPKPVEQRSNILVIGGAGFFGNILARAIIDAFREEPLLLTVGGRAELEVQETVKHLRNFVGLKKSQVTVLPAMVDLHQHTEESLAKLMKQTGVSLVVNVAGPFITLHAKNSAQASLPDQAATASLALHHQRLVTTCATNNIHYVDIAESAAFMQALVAHANTVLKDVPESRACIVTGASTVPAVSTAFAAEAIRLMMQSGPSKPSSSVETSTPIAAVSSATSLPSREEEMGTKKRQQAAVSIEVALSPGGLIKQKRPGYAAVQSLFLRLGSTFPVIADGVPVQRASWTNLQRCTFLPPVGPRFGCELELPEVALTLEQQKDPQQQATAPIRLENYSFQAGLERPTFTLAMSCLGFAASKSSAVAWLLRHRFISRVVWYIATGTRRFLGSGNGAFLVRATSKDAALGGATTGACLTLISRNSDGANVPILPVLHVIETLLVRKTKVTTPPTSQADDPSTSGAPAAPESAGFVRPRGAFVCATNVLDGSRSAVVPTISDLAKFISLLNLPIAIFGARSVMAAAVGADFAKLHPNQQAFHALQSTVAQKGHVSGALQQVTMTGSFTAASVWNPLLKLAGLFMGLPQGVPAPTPFTMRITAAGLEETWERRFPGRPFRMRSTLLLAPPIAGRDDEVGFHVAETFFGGFVKFYFRMRAEEAQRLPFGADHPVKAGLGSTHVLLFEFITLQVAGFTVPSLLHPKIEAVEYGVDDSKTTPGSVTAAVTFDVKASAPLGLGLLCHYKGTVAVDASPAK